MAFVLAALALLITFASVDAQERERHASASFARASDDSRSASYRDHALRDDGFTGAFGVRQTVKNLGY